ncbi:MAG: O-methyltransferase [Armatimonadota bacterium]
MGSQLPQAVAEYVLALERPRHSVLLEMERIAREEQFPIIGPECGRVLAVLSAAIGARRVFEMGSGFGYSTLWFALAVGEGGEVVHTDSDETNSQRAREFLSRAGVEARCRFLLGDAHELLVAETEPFDCILIDIEKPGYPQALEEAVPRLRPGGLLFAHNVLWSGRVANPSETDDATEGIREFNRAARSRPDLVTFLNPVDDGLSVSLRPVVPGQLEALGL